MPRRAPFPKGDPRAREFGQIGGRITGEKFKARREQEWRQRYPGVEPSVSSAIYRDGYDAGRKRKVRPHGDTRSL